MSTEQELTELMGLVDGYGNDVGAYQAIETRLRAILAELEAAREDAARYRWLREESDLTAGWHGGIALAGFVKGEKHKSGLDDAIDAARKGEA